MKREYELPELEVVEIEVTDIVTASPGGQHAGGPDCLVDF